MRGCVRDRTTASGSRAANLELGAGGAGADLDAAPAAMDTRPLSSAERGHVTIDGRALLIYTSGTTGLPKAANVSHRRILSWGAWFAGLTNASVDDRSTARQLASSKAVHAGTEIVGLYSKDACVDCLSVAQLR
ncbi:AMP-binding protein [Bradyrhizobium valentinum]|uniref:AMP-binding protein n=1 Tax=Bradyrhizobium valentinum TaxID=1518501 RepID=UPI00070F9EC0|nr:AMP-binding protein [Bradyrhizobium valentinum]KRR09508.1 hypothetical protein CQ10_13770 [Bradyrhizobium valentinum]